MKFYPKVRPVGHREIAELLDGEVVVQEKIDGSNFAFGKTIEGTVFCLSRTQRLDITDETGQFGKAVAHVNSIADRIPDGRLFRCEYLAKPKHNVLAYERAPKGNLVLFDVETQTPTGCFITVPLPHRNLEELADLFEIDVVPEFYRGPVRLETLKGHFSMWERQPALLGGEIEGVVIKNYERWNRDGNILVGKFVRDSFKESHNHLKTTSKVDVLSDIGAQFGGPARWRKAVQYLRDNNKLVGGMEDIPNIMKRIQQDVEEEESDAIKEALWNHYRKNILKATTKGMPEWWKGELGILS